jgi:hypothetical protein
VSDISISDLIAQFSNPKPEPELTQDALDATAWFKGFQFWLENDYEATVHSPRKPGLHASGLGKVCGRRLLVVEVYGATTVPNTAGNYLTFDIGHALHFWWQERYLGPKQELHGDWMCVACVCPLCNGAKTITRSGLTRDCDACRGTGRKVTRGLMPLNCECGVPWQDAIRYMELPVEDEELGYVGHCDGILVHKPHRRLFEFKTMSPSEYEKWFDNPANPQPRPEHVVQAHAYMGPLDLDEALIVYVNKGSQCKWSVDRCGQFVAGDPKVMTFLIKWDQALWDGIVERIRNYHAAVEVLNNYRSAGKPLPRAEISNQPRVCEDMKCDMAQRCPVSRECFHHD